MTETERHAIVTLLRSQALLLEAVKVLLSLPLQGQESANHKEEMILALSRAIGYIEEIATGL